MTFQAGFVFCAALLAMGRVAAAESQATVADWNNKGAAAFLRGDWAEAERLLSAAAAAGDSLTDNLARASIEFNMGALARSLARNSEAERHYRNSLALRESVLGENDASLAPVLRGLSMTLLARGEAAPAEDCGIRAAAVTKTIGGSEWGLALSDLARIQLGRGEWKAAANSANLALTTLHEREAGYPELLTTLGVIARHNGLLDASEQYARQAGAMMAQTLGERHPSTAAAWNNLAQVRVAQGKTAEAMELYKRATSAWITALGPQHPSVAMGMANQGQLALQLKQYKDAEPLFVRAIAIDREVFGERGTRVAMDWNNLGSLAAKRRRFDEAIGHYEHALASATENEDRGLVAGNLGPLYCRAKRWSEAAALLTDAVRVRESQYGPEDVQLGQLLEWQALALRRVQDYSRAAEVELKATRIRVRQALRK